MSSHVIHFTAPINSATTGRLIDCCSQAVQQGAEGLVIKIATMGGECSYGFSLYNYIAALPIPVRTHNLGTVESMGNIIFLAGSQRSACLHSKFLFHPFHWHLNGSVDHARMLEYAMALDYDLSLYARIVAERTATAAEPLNVIDYLKAAPRILDSQEALMTGLIHEIDEMPIDPGAINWCVHS
jgi:ATP-dependent protease ClpP protease subunit